MRVIIRALKIWSGALVLCALWLRCTWGRASKRSDRLCVFGRRMARLIEWLGPSFIKIGQLLSTRADLLPREITAELARLQDNVRPASARATRRWWQKIAPVELQTRCANLELLPFAAGSVSQVHLARTHQGETIAVKIQRPGLAALMETDLLVLRWMGRLVRRTKGLRDMPVVEVIDEIGRVLRGQLNFSMERETLEAFRELLADCKDITFPRVYLDWSNERVLAQELLTDLIRIDDLSIADEDFQYFGDLLLQAIYRMIFVGGVVHCDLHPANIYVRDRKLVVLDAGFSVRLDAVTQVEFARFFRALAFNEGRVCAEIMLRLASSHRDTFDFERFCSDVDAIIGASSNKMARDFSVALFAFQLFDCQRRHGLAASSQFVMAVWSLLVVEGIVRQRWPDVNFQAKAIPYLIDPVIDPAPRREYAA